MTTITHELDLAASAQAVSAAVTSPEGIRGWWAKDADVGSGVGSKHALRFVKEDRTVTMGFEVTEIADGRVTWRCTENGNPVWVGTTLSWTWTEAAGRTKLQFSHAGFAEDASPPYAMTVEGWKHFMASLVAYVETGAGQPW